MTDTGNTTVQPVSSSPKALKVAAMIISYLFHPVFMPVLMTLAMYRLAPVNFAGVSSITFMSWVLPIAFSTLALPLFIIFLLKKLDFISSFHMREPKERIIPFICVMTCYFWIYLIAKNKEYATILQVMLLGNFWGVMILFLINIFMKISMHAVAAGGLVGITIVLMIISPVSMVIPLFVALLVAGMMGTSRLILHAHRPGEVWLGYLFGVLVQVGAYYYLS